MIPPVDPESSPKSAQILAQLDRVLSSTPFRTSKRCSDLLRHVVTAACEGRLDFLKERTLGVEVFERDPDYDTNQDPVVRNTAGQVRKRLARNQEWAACVGLKDGVPLFKAQSFEG